MTDNLEIKELRRTTFRYLKFIGKTPKATIPLSVSLLLVHLFNNFVGVPQKDGVIDRMDNICHSISVDGSNIGARFDKCQLLKYSHLTLAPQSSKMTIVDPTKNRDTDKYYELIDWEGDALSGVAAMEPNLSMFNWVEVRGPSPGYLYCDIEGEGVGQRVIPHRPLPVEKYKRHMAKRAIACGWSKHDAEKITGYSFKRFGVQLLRMLGLDDDLLMDGFHLTSLTAFLRYTELNNCGTGEVPKFTSIKAFLSHARKLEAEHAFAEMTDSASESESEE